MTGASTRPPLRLRRKLLYSLVTLLVVLSVLEGGARLLTRATREETASTWQEHTRLVSAIGLPALNGIMEYDPQRFWRLKPQVRDQLVDGAIGPRRIRFRVSTHDSLRSPPLTGGNTRQRILALGDSCTFGLGVEDDETWPAQLQQLLARDGLNVDVINSGVPGYSSFQGLRFLEAEGNRLQPDVVVVCFGFNDRETWASRSDYQTERLLAVSRVDSILMNSRFYASLKSLRSTSRAAPGSSLSSAPRLSLREFHQTLAAIRTRGQSIDARLVLLVWPYEPQVQRGVHELEAYQQAVVDFGEEQQTPVINLVESFIAADAALFLDHIHANAAGCGLVAETLRPVVIGLLNSESTAELRE